MGADMLLCCAPACELTRQRIQRVRQVIRAIPAGDEDFRAGMALMGYDDAAKARRAFLRQGLASQREDREIVTLQLPGCPYRVRAAGGLSWGDPPSQGYTDLEHVERSPPLWQILEEFAREDALAARAFPARGPQVDLKLGDTLTVRQHRPESGRALLGDGQGRVYELHTDECHALTFQQLVDACRQTLESLERDPAPEGLTAIKKALRDALAAVR